MSVFHSNSNSLDKNAEQKASESLMEQRQSLHKIYGMSRYRGSPSSSVPLMQVAESVTFTGRNYLKEAQEQFEQQYRDLDSLFSHNESSDKSFDSSDKSFDKDEGDQNKEGGDEYPHLDEFRLIEDIWIDNLTDLKSHPEVYTKLMEYLQEEDFEVEDPFLNDDWSAQDVNCKKWEWSHDGQIDIMWDICGFPGDNEDGAIWLNDQLIAFNGDMDIASHNDKIPESVLNSLAHLRFFRDKCHSACQQNSQIKDDFIRARSEREQKQRDKYLKEFFEDENSTFKIFTFEELTKHSQVWERLQQLGKELNRKYGYGESDEHTVLDKEIQDRLNFKTWIQVRDWLYQGQILQEISYSWPYECSGGLWLEDKLVAVSIRDELKPFGEPHEIHPKLISLNYLRNLPDLPDKMYELD